MGVFEGFSMWIGKMMAEIFMPVAIILLVIVLFLATGHVLVFIDKVKKKFGKGERGKRGEETGGTGGGGNEGGEI